MGEEDIERQRKRRGKRKRKPVPPPQADFDNREYWEARYAADLDDGSGSGSGGGYLERKQELLGRLMIDVIDPRSILDVGCGSVEVVKDISFSGKYTGIDLSPSIIKRNRQVRPDWTFIEGDFLALAPGGGLDADLVICFDVLAYQHDEETYQRFVQELMNVTRRVAIINGFDASHGRGKAPKMTAYHEPLSDTLLRLDAGQVTKVGRFRGTNVFRLDKLPMMSVE